MDYLEPGMKVKMSQAFKEDMLKGESKEHILEFGECMGIVKGQFLDWPEFDVVWQPSGLKYLYLPENLDPWPDEQDSTL